MDLVDGLNLLKIDAELLVLNLDDNSSGEFDPLKVTSLESPKAALSVIALTRYLRKKRPDVMLTFPHLVNLPAIAAVRLARTKTKLIIGEHGIFSLDRSIEWKDSLRYRLLEILMPRLYPFADGIIACASDILDDLVRKCGFPLPKFQRAILNPINFEKVSILAKKEPVEPLRDFLASKFKIVTLARLSHQKNLETLIKAAAILRNNGMEFQIVIMGEGPRRPALEELIQAENLQKHVLLVGSICSPYPIVARSDVFVLSSAWEGCPISMLESMSLGIPCIGTDGPGAMRELMDNNSGFIVKVGDEKALAETIMKLNSSSDLRQSIGNAGKIRARELCHYDHIARLYLNAFQECPK